MCFCIVGLPLFPSASLLLSLFPLTLLDSCANACLSRAFVHAHTFLHLVKRIFILCARVKSTRRRHGFFELKKKKWVKMVKLFDFYGILKKDLWRAYEWTWDIVDFFCEKSLSPLR